MASGFARFAKANSTHSLGSFVDIASAASSEFEPIDLEELELAPNSSEMTSKDQGNNAPSSRMIARLRSSVIARVSVWLTERLHA